MGYQQLYVCSLDYFLITLEQTRGQRRTFQFLAYGVRTYAYTSCPARFPNWVGESDTHCQKTESSQTYRSATRTLRSFQNDENVGYILACCMKKERLPCQEDVT